MAQVRVMYSQFAVFSTPLWDGCSALWCLLVERGLSSPGLMIGWNACLWAWTNQTQRIPVGETEEKHKHLSRCKVAQIWQWRILSWRGGILFYKWNQNRANVQWKCKMCNIMGSRQHMWPYINQFMRACVLWQLHLQIIPPASKLIPDSLLL